jgi:LruC domain-containing protein
MAGYWPMEEGSGTQTINKVGNGMINLAAPDWSGSVDTDEDNVPNINDDYPYDATRAFDNFWPASQYGATLAFEDLWPSMADYDMNDAVIGYRFNNVTNASNKLVESFGNFVLKANGAGLNAGFGFSLPGNLVAADKFVLSGHVVNQGFITLDAINHSEDGQTYLTIIPRDLLPKIGNTRIGQNTGTYPFTIRLAIIGGGDYGVNAFGFQTWNPFIMVYGASSTNKRGHEIHLAGYPPSLKVDIALFDSVNDGSQYPLAGGGNLWYKTNVKSSASGDLVGQYFPWGIDIPGNFSWTREADATHDPSNGFYRPTIWYGYLKFKQWASSNGTEALDWYSGTGVAYRDTDFIYHP